MSDRSQDSQKMISPVAEDLTAVMNVAIVVGRSFAELVNATDSRKPGYVPTKPKGAPKKTPVLSSIRQTNTAKEMAIVLTPLISKRFALSNSVTKKLHTQLLLYFKATGIIHNFCLGIMMESSSWALPEYFVTSGQSLEQLIVPVRLLFTKLATYYVQQRHESLHLTTGVLFTDLATWYENYMKKEAKKRPKAILSQE